MRLKKPTKGQPDLNLPLNIALTGVKAGLDIAAQVAKSNGDKDALQSAFAGLLALASQAIGKAEAKPGQTGDLKQTAQNWLQAQLGDGKITLDGKTLSIDGKPVDVKNLLAQLLGGAGNLDILGMIGELGANQANGQFAKMLQSSAAYQGMTKASASVSLAINALPATSAAQAISDKAIATIFANNAKAANIADPKAPTTIAANETGAQLSKAELAKLALPAPASPVATLGAKPETSAQPVSNLLAALAQNQNEAPLAKQLQANGKGGQTPANASQVSSAAQASQTTPQLSQVDALAAQIQNQFSPNAQNKTDKKTKTGFTPQNANSFQPGSNPSNPAVTPLQILQAKAVAAANSDPNGSGSGDVDPNIDTSIKALQSAAGLTQTNTGKGQVNVFSPVQAGLQAPQINLPNVAFAIARNLSGGNNRFQIRLDPPELGRVDVRLEVKKDGTTNARLSVDRQDTLDLLQRDARALQRALVQAGFDSSQTNLEFSLKQNPFAGQGSGNENTPRPFNDFATSGTIESAAPDQVISAYRGYISPGGVSLWV
ncbi:Flagellar hook-length control protein FliK [hydrothermal vent metagenome]|uniref:Flagellar hook-length control protein FliK n=1 Tax=hydrothermal vent metagenome TaxID=652676 RepID=A0A3B0TF68_9ZZZZ